MAIITLSNGTTVEITNLDELGAITKRFELEGLEFTIEYKL